MIRSSKPEQLSGDLDFWRLALEDEMGAALAIARRINVDCGDALLPQMFAGWYRRRAHSWRQRGLSSPWLGVVIWKGKSKVWCMQDGHQPTNKEVLDICTAFERCWQHPVSKEAYDFWKEYGEWADDPLPEEEPKELKRLDQSPPIFSEESEG